MRTTPRTTTVATVTLSTLTLLFAIAIAIPTLAAAVQTGNPPTAVSPGGETGAVIQSRCPTFSWSATEGARGYELALYRVEDREEGDAEAAASADTEATATTDTELVTRIQLPGGTTGWTPAMSQCLEWGGNYAWSVRALDGTESSGAEQELWSEANLFRVSGTPSATEVESAIETLKRYLETQSKAGGSERADQGQADGPEIAREALKSIRKSQRRDSSPETRTERTGAPLKSETVSAAASAPSLGDPSLTVDANIALGPGSNLFKDYVIFLWDDDDGNLALGESALTNATTKTKDSTAIGYAALTLASGEATGNTAVGNKALTNTTEGLDSFQGSSNTAVGDRALYINKDGHQNTAIGSLALLNNDYGDENTGIGVSSMLANTGGSQNTALGDQSLRDNTYGDSNTAVGHGALLSKDLGNRNTAIGAYAGNQALGGNDNIFLGSGAYGASGDTNTIRIGGSTGTGSGQQNRTFIAGNVGLGGFGATEDPETRLHVRDSVSGASGTLANHVALIDNTSSAGGADVLALRINESPGNIGSENNFISFRDTDGNSVGAIEGTGGGVTLTSGSGDFAEYLPKRGSRKRLSPGTVVGLKAGSVSLVTEDAERTLVVTSSPVVLGNDPGVEKRADHVAVAFLGQVPVRVRGHVDAGELLIPSGKNDGFARAAPETLQDPALLSRVIGRALATADRLH